MGKVTGWAFDTSSCAKWAWASLVACVALSACKEQKGPFFENPEQIFESRLTTGVEIQKDPEQLKYRYNDEKRRCFNKNGVPGRNLQIVGECGELLSGSVVAQDLSNMSLRGFRSEGSDFSGSNFANSDLQSTSFMNARFQSAHFENAKLQFATLRSEFSGLSVLVESFQGAHVNTETELPYDFSNPGRYHVDALEKAGVIFDGLLELDSSNPLAKIELDQQALSLAERKLIQSDLSRLAKLRIKAESKGLYAQAFGGVEADAALRYLSRRVKFVGGTAKEAGAATVAMNPSALYYMNQLERDFSAKLKESFRVVMELGEAFLPGETDTLFHSRDRLNVVLREDSSVPFVNGKALDLSQPAVGLMHPGPLYMGTKLKSLERIATWIHEARHSDCPDGDGRFHNKLQALVTRVAKYKADLNGLFATSTEEQQDIVIAQNSELNAILDEYQRVRKDTGSCWNLHALCPHDHPDSSLRDIAACDKGSWGAYAVGAAFWSGVANGCANCTEEERQLSAISMLDSMNRQIDLDLQNGDVREGLDQEKPMSALEGLD